MACRFPGTNPERRGLTPTAQSAHPSFHVMAFRCQCIWKSIFSFSKSHRQMYWVAVPHMTSQLPEGNLMQVDEKLVISVIPPQQWCTHLKMHMIAMHQLCTSSSCFIMIFELAGIWPNLVVHISWQGRSQIYAALNPFFFWQTLTKFSDWVFKIFQVCHSIMFVGPISLDF